jgi:hypothetical protein
MKTSKIRPDRLIPDKGWFLRRLKIYFWVAVGSALTFLFVAGWLAEPSSNAGVVRDLFQAATASAAGVAFWLSQTAKGSEDESHRNRM